MKTKWLPLIAIGVMTILFTLASTSLIQPEIHSAGMNVWNHINGEGDGSSSNVSFGIELFLFVDGDVSNIEPGDIHLTVDGSPVPVSEIYDVFFDGGQNLYYIEAGVDPTSFPHTLGEYSVSVTDTNFQTSATFVIGDLEDYPKDAPDFFTPQHFQPSTDSQPNFTWESFQSEYNNQLVAPWAYEINLERDDFYYVFPIPPSQTSLAYTNPDWEPGQPPPLDPGIYGVTVHSNHSVSENINLEHHRSIRLVVYDPTGGFITGGGWIESPEGAYLPDEELKGTANFGFVAKYKKNGIIPTGQLEFQFQEGDLNFHSEDYLVLIISESEATLIGSGTVNGMGNYGFFMVVTDGKLNGSGIDTIFFAVYDPNTGEDLYLNSQELQGGNIVIHKK